MAVHWIVRLLLACGASFLTGYASTAPALAGVEAGAWQKDTWTQVNIGCVQRWTCHPKTAVLHGPDQFVAVTKPANTVGACAAGGGPIDSCNLCLAAEPADKCVWQLQKKK